MKDRIGLFQDGDWIETLSGAKVNPVRMKPEDVKIEDIIQPLSQICRFVGQCNQFYSVGQHSLYVSEIVYEELAPFIGSQTNALAVSVKDAATTALAALLHDASEAYTGDISRPMKYSVKGFKELELVIDGVINEHFNLHGADWELIKKADNMMLAAEADQLMPSKGQGWYLPERKADIRIVPMTPVAVRVRFLARYTDLQNRRA